MRAISLLTVFLFSVVFAASQETIVIDDRKFVLTNEKAEVNWPQLCEFE